MSVESDTAIDLPAQPMDDTRAWRPTWIEFALASAAIVVVLATILSVLRVPKWVGNITLFHLGSVLGDTDKVWMALVWVASAACVVLCLVLEWRSRRNGNRLRGRVIRIIIAIGACAGVLVTLVALVRKNKEILVPGTFPGYGWLGLGIAIVLGAIVLFFALTGLINSRVLMIVSVIAVAVLAFAPLFETVYTFTAGGNNTFTFDELLAPASGRLPGFDYITQYESLLGLPLGLLAIIAPAWIKSDPAAFALAWLITLQVITIAAGVFSVMRLTPRRFRWIIPITIVPFAYLAGPAGLIYYAVLPMRLFLPTMMLLALVLIGTGRRRFGWRWAPVIVGLIAGTAALNNLDFGVPALLAGLIAVIVDSRKVLIALRRAALFVAGVVIVPVLYIGIGTLTGHTYHPTYALFFVRSFGVNNFMNVDMPAFGLHDGFVLLGVIGLVLGALGSRRTTLRNPALYRAMMFQSSFLLLSLVYFSGRSLTETLVTSESLIAAVLFGLLIAAGAPRARLLWRKGVGHWGFADWVSAVMILLSVGLPLAAWKSFPLSAVPWRIERALNSPSATVDYLRPDPTPALKALPAGTSLAGILIDAGSIWSLKTGVTNANLFLHTGYLDPSFPTGAELECRYIEGLKGDAILTTRVQIALLTTSPVCHSLLDFSSITKVTIPDTHLTNPGSWVLIRKR